MDVQNVMYLLKKVEDEIRNSYIIYECGFLEVVDNLDVVKEMYRIAG